MASQTCQIIGLLLVLQTVPQAFATASNVERSRSDRCEDRIKQIREDLASWIYKGGAQSLNLPEELSSDEYSDLMLEQIKTARVRCVSAGDAGYPVTISGKPRVCKFSKKHNDVLIACDYRRFLTTDESDQYVLIHHVYAGLAGVERPNSDDSHYEISDQISGYLETQVVKKLTVRPSVRPCRSINLRTAPLNTKCRTSSGGIYERVSQDNFGEAWKGPNGLIWSDMIVSSSDHYHAIEICNRLGGRLPSVADFQSGSRDGFIEVLPNFRNNFWASDIQRFDSSSSTLTTNVFTGQAGGGIVYNVLRTGSSAVRCVRW